MATMEITIHEEKISHFTFHRKQKGPITSHENTLYLKDLQETFPFVKTFLNQHQLTLSFIEIWYQKFSLYSKSQR